MTKEIPDREKWVHNNPEVLKSIKEGMKQANEGKVVEKDFSEFADTQKDS
jgi:predicted transcriptional regulator